MEQVVARVLSACESGAKEAVLTGVLLGSYGRGLPGRADLRTLIRAFLDDTGIARLRLSSLEPWGLPDGFLDLWPDERLCPSLHLPLQSGCDATLRRMRRPMTTAAFSRVVGEARAAIPGVAIPTDIMIGFPGETDADAATSHSFVESMAFADGHIFTFSARPATTAARLPNPMPATALRLRARRMRTIVDASAQEFRAAWIGRPVRVLWQRPIHLGPHAWQLTGLSDQGLVVRSRSSAPLSNSLGTVTPDMLEDGELWCADPTAPTDALRLRAAARDSR